MRAILFQFDIPTFAAKHFPLLKRETATIIPTPDTISNDQSVSFYYLSTRTLVCVSIKSSRSNKAVCLMDCSVDVKETSLGLPACVQLSVKANVGSSSPKERGCRPPAFTVPEPQFYRQTAASRPQTLLCLHLRPDSHLRRQLIVLFARSAVIH